MNEADYVYCLYGTRNFMWWGHFVQIEIDAASLTVTTYPVSKIPWVGLALPSGRYGDFCSPLYYCNGGSPYPGNITTFTVTITRIVDGYADGTFSGIIWKEPGATAPPAPPGVAPPVYYPITEGEFKNVKIVD